MLRKVLLPTILLVLAYGFRVSPNFKVIAAGIAIFLFGMRALQEGFRAVTGGTLEQLLRLTTSTTGKSVLFGIVSTTLMQSSSLVAVITISFLSAGLITLAAGIGIIFGDQPGHNDRCLADCRFRSQGQYRCLRHADVGPRGNPDIPVGERVKGRRLHPGGTGICVSRHPLHERGV